MDERQQSLQQLIQALLTTGQTQYNLGDYDGAIASHREMLDHARTIADSSMESLALAWLGSGFWQKGELAKAIALFEQRLAISRRLKDLNDLAVQRETLGWLGDIAKAQSQPEQAIAYYTQQLAIIQKLEDKSAEQSLLYKLGSLHDDLKDYTKALACFMPALNLAQELDQPANIANASFMLGQTYRNLGQRTEAITHYQIAVALYTQPENKTWAAKALSYLAGLYRDAKDYENAVIQQKQRLDLVREMGDLANEQSALYDLGCLYDDLQQYDQAQKYFLKAVKLAEELEQKRNEANACYMLGQAYRNSKQLDWAISSYEQAANLYIQLEEKDWAAKALSHLGTLYRKKEDYQTAIEKQQQRLILVQESNDTYNKQDTLYDIGYLYDDIEDYGQALNYFTQALELAQQLNLQTNVANAHYWIGQAYRHLNQTTKAIVHYSSAVEIYVEVENKYWAAKSLKHLGDFYYETHNYGKAVECQTQRLSIAQEMSNSVDQKEIEANAHFNLGYICHSLSECDEAIINLQKAYFLYIEIEDQEWTKIVKDSLEFFQETRLLKQARALDDDSSLLVLSEAILEKQSSLVNVTEYALVSKGAALLNLERNEEASEWFEHVVKLIPESHDAWRIYSIVLHRLDQLEKALLACQKSLKINPSSPRGLRELAVLLYKLNQSSEALIACKNFLEIVPDDDQIWAVKGDVLESFQRYGEAIDCYQNSLSFNPGNIDASNKLRHLSTLLYQLGQSSESLNASEKLLEVYPDDGRVWSIRGNVFASLEQYEEAANCYKKSLSINSNDIDTSRNLVVSLYRLDYLDEALSACNNFLKICPEDALVWTVKGSLLSSLERYEEAVSCYRECLSINPENIDVLNRIGSVLARLEYYEEAISYLDQALDLDFKLPDTWELRGSALWALGRTAGIQDSQGKSCFEHMEESLRSCDNAVMLDPTNKGAWYNKGIVLWNLHRFEEALFAFDKGIELDANSASAWKMRGVTLRDLDKLSEAIIAFDHALLIADNQLPAAWTDKAIAVYSLYGYEAAIQTLNEGLEKLRDLPKYEDFSESYQEACQSLHYNSGVIHYQSGRWHQDPLSYWEKALKSYQKSLTLLSEKATENRLSILESLVVICRGLNANKEGKELLRQASELLARLLEDTPSPGRKILVCKQFSNFNELRIDELVASGKSIEALELAEQRKNVCLSWSRYGYSETVPSPSYSDIQALLNPNTTAVYWHLSPAAITLFILRHGRAPVPLILHYQESHITFETHAHPEAAAYASRACYLVEQWIANWKQTYQNEQETWKAEMPEQLENLAKLMGISAILPYLEGIQNLILLPHRDLHLLPLHALFPKSFTQQVTIRYLPSAKMGLERLQSHQKSSVFKRSVPLLNVENPENNLPYAAVESAVIRKLFSHTEQLQGDAASQEAVSQALYANSGIFHYGGHASHNLSRPDESSLHLSNGDRLTLQDIFGLDLRAYDLVNLSACETGMTGQQGLIDEFVGLVSGFLAVGAKAVVSSLWRVSDLSTALLMLKFYERLQHPSGYGAIATALNHAQHWLRTMTLDEFEQEWQRLQSQLQPVLAQMRPGQRVILNESIKQLRQRLPHPFANPYYWAGFTVYGL